MDIFDFFSPSLPKNRFWGRNLKNLSPDLESTSPRYFEFLAQNWGNCPITCNIFVLITLRVLQRAKWRLKWDRWRWVELRGGRWSWMEVDGAGWRCGWRWVHSLPIPIHFCFLKTLNIIAITTSMVFCLVKYLI